jgi:DNA-binding protein HU-beta
MNKTELIANVAEEAKISKTDAAEAIEATFSAIEKALKSGEEVRIIGFGSFQVSDRAESTRRNPSTGKPMTVPAARVPKFKAGKALRDALNS